MKRQGEIMSTRSPGTYVEVNDEFITKRRANGDILLVKLDESETYFTINGIAADIWEEVSSGHSIETVKSVFAKKHADDAKELELLVDDFIKDLVKNKILKLNKVK